MSPSLQFKPKVALAASERIAESFSLLEGVALACEVELVPWNTCEPSSLAGVILIRMPGCKEQLPDPPPCLPSFRIELLEQPHLPAAVVFAHRPVLPRISYADGG